MKQRIITTLILAPLVIAGIFLLPQFGFFIAMSAIAVIGFWEWTQFTNQTSKNVVSRYSSWIVSFIVLAFSFYALPIPIDSSYYLTSMHRNLLLVGAIWWLVASLLVLTFPKSRKLWENHRILKQLFGWLTILPFLWSVLILRAENYTVDPFYGAKLVMLVCFLVWAADSGAYFAGRAFGKHKMSPSVSPNKTIEGLIGGGVAALFIGWGATSLFDIQFESTISMFGFFIATVLISVFGDLVESMFKRVANIKDSGTIIPGHGGILDRIDSLTAAFPIFAFLYFL